MSGYPPNYDNKGYPPQQQNQGYPPQGQGYSGQQGYPPQQNQGYPPQANYAKPSVAPFNGGQASSTAALGPSGQGDRFAYTSGPKYHDVWATVLFLLDFIAFAILSAISISALGSSSKSSSSGSSSGSSGSGLAVTDSVRDKLIGLLVAGTVVAAALCGLWTYFMKRFPEQIIHGTFIASIVLYFVIGGIAILKQAYIMAAIYIIAGAVHIFLYLVWRHLIPFTAMILKVIVSIGDKYPASYLFAVLSLILTVVYQVWWVITLVAALQKYSSSNGTSDNMQYILILFLVFSMYWTGEIIRNTLHVTVSGTVASYYFLAGTSAMPASPTLAAAKRAFSTSFGPIAFGSLIVALIKTVRYILRSAARQGSIVALIANCLLGCVEGLVKYFNSYAYIYVAMYGTSFCDAAKATFELIKRSGFEAMMNDSFVGHVLTIGSLFVGLVAAAVGYIGCLILLNTSEQSDYAGYMILLAFVLLFLGCIMMNIVGQFIQSGASTLFVCMAEDPSSLARNHPQVYAEFKQKYPQIAWRI